MSESAWPQEQEEKMLIMSESACEKEQQLPVMAESVREQDQLPAMSESEREQDQPLQQVQDQQQHQPLQTLQDTSGHRLLMQTQDTSVRSMTWYLNVPGIRFIPSDIELIVDYLQPKLRGEQLPTNYVHVCDIYSDHPEKLTSQLGGSVEGNWYIFSPRNRKYPNGGRPRRETGNIGFWKSTTKKEPILGTPGEDGRTEVIGYKGCLTYHVSDGNNMPKKPKKEMATKTAWKMWEFVCTNSNRPPTAEEEPMRLNDWVLCKITNKETCEVTKPNKKRKLQEKQQSPYQIVAVEQPLESGWASSSQAKELQEETPRYSLSGGGDAAAAAADPTPLQMMPPPLDYNTLELYGLLYRGLQGLHYGGYFR